MSASLQIIAHTHTHTRTHAHTRAKTLHTRITHTLHTGVDQSVCVVLALLLACYDFPSTPGGMGASGEGEGGRGDRVPNESGMRERTTEQQQQQQQEQEQREQPTWKQAFNWDPATKRGEAPPEVCA
jgi:hypothetical protein